MKKTKITKTDLHERVPKLVKGYFKIESIDENGNVIDSYEDYNKVVVWVYNIFAKSVYGNEQPNIDDYRIHSFAIGTDGVDDTGVLRDIAYNQRRLYSEDRFWEGNYEEEMKSYVYQITFNKPTTDDPHSAVKTDEGATFPHYAGVPKAYRGTAYNAENEKEGAVSMTRSFSGNVLHQEIYIGKLAANGHPMWDTAVEFNEAALYMTPEATDSGDYLGLMFSMKTFPGIKKTEACVIKIQWDLSFEID